jgi:catechol 2,3-dioxygenase-like lactoylglutathione lyase family enzyme
MNQAFHFHHVAMSVANLDRSMAFYDFFGFQLALKWEAVDKSLAIAHLVNREGACIEIVCYAANNETKVSPPVGNDLTQVGVKHFALAVDDLAKARDEIIAKDLGEITDIQQGRTKIDFFFVRDPDGLWVEVVNDRRALDPKKPTHISEAPRLIPGE